MKTPEIPKLITDAFDAAIKDMQAGGPVKNYECLAISPNDVQTLKTPKPEFKP